ncbi:3-deoxy-8-phosphooctulonate synthase [candidate division GN15 bacterium]|nr:3-deoxy-8-phosphooctulonate synthase [candidate division GN15 bacterium]
MATTVERTLNRIADGDFFLIAGPCVVESEALCLEIADHIGALADRFETPFVFKSSFTKANRTSPDSYTGPGVDAGLTVLRKVKETARVPVLTDVHETTQVDPVAEVADILQIPAFLSRQTELIAKAGASGRWVNIKKGQFLAPEDMALAAEKAGSDKVMLTERGSSFGYRNLVVDFRSLIIMSRTGRPVVFDATHSLQRPGAGDGVSTGQPEFVIPMARAAVAVGVNGLFVETHPDPAKGLSDAGAMLPMADMERLLSEVLAIRDARKHKSK